MALSTTGAITTSASTAIVDGGAVGDVLVLINTSANNLIVKDGANTKFSGDLTLAGNNDDALIVIWDGSDWVAISDMDN